MKTVKILLLTLSILLLSFASSYASQKHRVVVILATSTSLGEIVPDKFDVIDRLISKSSIGLVSIRIGRGQKELDTSFIPVSEANYVTIGATSPALGGPQSRDAINAEDTLEAISYHIRTGRTVIPGHVYASKIPAVTKLNISGSYEAIPGQLGTAIHANSGKTAVFGNADIPDVHHREAVYIAADRNGAVDVGDVSSSMLTYKYSNFPYGLRANSQYIAGAVKTRAKNCSLVIVDPGDTLRADLFTTDCIDTQIPVIRNAAISSLCTVISDISKVLTPNDYLVVMSANAPLYQTTLGQRMGWIAISGPGIQPGLLRSSSTRSTGVISILDIAPTFLKLLDMPIQRQMTGIPVSTVKVEAKTRVQKLLNIEERAEIQTDRLSVMRGSSVVMTVIILLATVGLLGKTNEQTHKLVKWGIVWISSIPLSLLLLPLISNSGALQTTIWSAFLSIILTTAGIIMLKNPRTVFCLISGITLITIIIDLITGSRLASVSPAGYSLAEGARFYGIGNELMGVALGCAPVALSAVLPLLKKQLKFEIIFSAAVLVGLFVIIGYSGIGANVGGALSVMPAAAVFVHKLRGKRLNAKILIIAGIITIVAVGIIFAVDIFRSSAEQSHAARLALRMGEGQSSSFLTIAIRKLTVNFILVGASLWSRLLGAVILCSIVFTATMKKKMITVTENRYNKAAIYSLVIGITGAFIFNDSGVVAAANCCIYYWGLLALDVLEARSKQKQQESSIA